MKLKANYNAEIDVLDLQYDLEAQVIIRKAALQISAIIGGRNPAAITQQQGLARTDNLFEGLKLLEMIARRKSLRIRTTQQEAELTLGLLCFANLYFDGKQMASRSVSKVVTMVAGITPVVVFGLMMPSRVKVLEGRGSTAATRKLLEIVRTSTGELFVQEAFLLSRELKQISWPSRTLRKFIGELEMTSPAYWAMNKVLKLGGDRRRNKKRNEINQAIR